MPKATDVNGVEWGKSELTISGLAALGVLEMLLLVEEDFLQQEVKKSTEKKAQKEAKEPLRNN